MDNVTGLSAFDSTQPLKNRLALTYARATDTRAYVAIYL